MKWKHAKADTKSSYFNEAVFFLSSFVYVQRLSCKDMAKCWSSIKKKTEFLFSKLYKSENSKTDFIDFEDE